MPYPEPTDLFERLAHLHKRSRGGAVPVECVASVKVVWAGQVTWEVREGDC